MVLFHCENEKRIFLTAGKEKLAIPMSQSDTEQEHDDDESGRTSSNNKKHILTVTHACTVHYEPVINR